MTFKQIVSGNTLFKFVLIEDSLDRQSNILLKAFAHEGIDCGKQVHVLCFDDFPANIESNIKAQRSSRLHYYDYFTDSMGWLKETNSQKDSFNKSIFSSIEKPSSDSTGLLVLIDSLSSFILLYGFREVYKQIHEFINSDVSKGGLKQLVGVLNTDTLLNYDAAFSQLHYLSTTSVSISRKSLNTGNLTINVEYKKANGTLIKQYEECWVDSHSVLQTKKIEHVKESLQTNSELPSQLTTFNIGLTDEEKEARSKLVLPYLKSDSEKAGGTIFYEPDENDDWDEEDPDDDLAI